MIVALPLGTIDAIDGGDVHIVHFRISDKAYAALVEALAYLLNGRGSLHIHA